VIAFPEGAPERALASVDSYIGKDELANPKPRYFG